MEGEPRFEALDDNLFDVHDEFATGGLVPSGGIRTVLWRWGGGRLIGGGGRTVGRVWFGVVKRVDSQRRVNVHGYRERDCGAVVAKVAKHKSPNRNVCIDVHNLRNQMNPTQ